MVRPAALADLEQICLIDPSIQFDLEGWERLQKAIGVGECLVAEQDHRLAGYGCTDYRFFERGFVSLVYVPIHHRRRGAASGLFDAFEERCKSTRIFTSTNLSNLPMQRF
jgi:hypothetical protein